MSVTVRPWKERWQVWKPSKKNGVPVFDREDELEALRLPNGAWCAVPARLVVAVPFWVEAADDGTAREIALLEMEMKGLASRERLAIDGEVEVLRREGGRALVRAMVYPGEWPRTLSNLKGARYVPSPLLAAYNADAVHVWREFDDLVAVVVWKEAVICWETIHWPVEQKEAAAWLKLLMIQLERELGVQEPFQLKEWFGVFDQVPEMFRSVPHFAEDDQVKGPPIKASCAPARWLPAEMRVAQAEQGKRRALLRLGGVATVLVAAAVAVFLVLNARLAWKIERANREIAVIEQEIAPSREIAVRWAQVEAAVDDRFHPLELLHEVVSALPDSGVRLTVFQISTEKVLIEGEAKNVSAATEFFGVIERGSKNGLRWEMTPPALQPNNMARFAITGERE